MTESAVWIVLGRHSTNNSDYHEYAVVPVTVSQYEILLKCDNKALEIANALCSSLGLVFWIHNNLGRAKQIFNHYRDAAEERGCVQPDLKPMFFVGSRLYELDKKGGLRG